MDKILTWTCWTSSHLWGLTFKSSSSDADSSESSHAVPTIHPAEPSVQRISPVETPSRRSRLQRKLYPELVHLKFNEDSSLNRFLPVLTDFLWEG